MQFKRIQGTKLIYHSPSPPDKECGWWFYLMCSSTNVLLKRIIFLLPISSEKQLGKISDAVIQNRSDGIKHTDNAKAVIHTILLFHVLQIIMIVSQLCWASQSLKWEGQGQETELFLMDKLKIHLILKLSVDIRNLWQCVWCWQVEIKQPKQMSAIWVRSDNHCTLCQSIIKHIFSDGRPFSTSVIKNDHVWKMITFGAV